MSLDNVSASIKGMVTDLLGEANPFTREYLLHFYVEDKIETGTDTILLFKIRRTCPAYMLAYEYTTTEKEWIKWFLESYLKVGTTVQALEYYSTY